MSAAATATASGRLARGKGRRSFPDALVPAAPNGAMSEFLSKLFDTTDFPARWNCGDWTPFHGSLHIVSDLIRG